MLENKLGITSSVELANEEEKITKLKALKLFDTNKIDEFEVGTFKSLSDIHKYLFDEIYSFAGNVRKENISKGNFRFASSMYLEDVLNKIDNMPQKNFDDIIKKYNNGKHDMNDLFQIGCIGLIKAVDNFDTSYNVQFSTYAVPLILGEVKRFIRDSTEVRIARSIRDTAYKILKFKDEYLLKNGIEPKNDIICKTLEITDYDLELALNSLKEPMSIFEPIYNDGGDTIYLADQIADIKNTNEDRDTLISLRKALLKIKQRERNILTDRYIVGKTQSEIASELGVSQAQISIIEKSAINNVKRLIK